jgi:hypothetical protein
VSGLLAGSLYRANVLYMKRWRFPGFIRRLSARLLLPLFSSKPVRRSHNTLPMDPRIGSTRGSRDRPTSTTMRDYVGTFVMPQTDMHTQTTGTTQTNTNSTASERPTEEQINMIADLFPNLPRDRISAALLASRNNPDRAINMLLDGN